MFEELAIMPICLVKGGVYIDSSEHKRLVEFFNTYPEMWEEGELGRWMGQRLRPQKVKQSVPEIHCRQQ